MKNLDKFIKTVVKFGGTPFAVGGWMRDFFVGREPVDMDIVITGMSEDTFVSAFPMATRVFSDAPIWIVDGDEVALARREVSIGSGKSAFKFVADPTFTIEDDLFRRDFTCNAIARNLATGEIHDPFGGIDDIRLGIIRPVSEHFVESPERVLRGCTLKARFPEWTFDRDFIIFADQMKADFHTIAPEQIARHIEKAFSKGERLSQFFFALMQTDWIIFFPELMAMIGCPQDVEWHPEGCVFTHTMFALDSLPLDAPFEVKIATVCHDMGKPATTTFDDDGRIRSRGHAEHIEPTISFLDRIGIKETVIREKVIALVKEHMFVGDTRKAVWRLSQRLAPATIAEWVMVVAADVSGRPERQEDFVLHGAEVPEHAIKVVEVSETLHVTEKKFDPILKGRHLIGLGLKPSPEFGRILRVAEEAEVEGKFSDLEGAIKWVKESGVIE